MDAKNYLAYAANSMNMDTTKVIQGKFYMDESSYERFETRNESGIRICFEFPKDSVNRDDIVQEVKAILEGELREALHKAAG